VVIQVRILGKLEVRGRARREAARRRKSEWIYLVEIPLAVAAIAAGECATVQN